MVRYRRNKRRREKEGIRGGQKEKEEEVEIKRNNKRMREREGIRGGEKKE